SNNLSKSCLSSYSGLPHYVGIREFTVILRSTHSGLLCMESGVQLAAIVCIVRTIYVKDVWYVYFIQLIFLGEGLRLLHDYRPTFLLRNTDEALWMHEWEVQGYCTKQTLTAANYFQRAMREIYFCLDKTMRRFVDCPVSLATRGCGPINNPREIIIPIKAIIL
ncbi:hypothetical protein H5410_024586, partial [Solanum commersonii]